MPPRLIIAAGIAGVLVAAATPAHAVAPCQAFAAQAVALANQNAARGCGFVGDRWSLDLRTHLNWCKAIGAPAANQDATVRAAQLQSCHS